MDVVGIRGLIREQTRCAPPESTDLTERRKGKAKSIALAVAWALLAPALAERAYPRAWSPGLLVEAVGRVEFLPAVALDGDWGSAIFPVTLKVSWRAWKQKSRLKSGLSVRLS